MRLCAWAATLWSRCCWMLAATQTWDTQRRAARCSRWVALLGCWGLDFASVASVQQLHMPCRANPSSWDISVCFMVSLTQMYEGEVE
jgi:hypothetical protein